MLGMWPMYFKAYTPPTPEHRASLSIGLFAACVVHAFADEAFAVRDTFKVLGLSFWARPKSADFPFLG